MTRKPRKNRKVSSQNKQWQLLDLIKTGIISAAFGSLLAFGYISIQTPFEEPETAQLSLDTGAAPKADDIVTSMDPTLVDELKLLKAERTVQEDADEEAPETEEPAPVEEIKEFPNFGVANNFHTQMLVEPKKGSQVISYARRGANFRVSERLEARGCSRGWYEVSPGSMYICAGEGASVASKPISFNPAPPQPKLHAPLPYSYGYSRAHNTLEYWRIPTPEEQADVLEILARITEKEALETDTGSDMEQAPAATDSDSGAADTESKPAPPTAAPTEEAALPTEGSEPNGGTEPTAPSAPEPSPQPQDLKASSFLVADNPFDTDTYDPFQLPPFVHLRMPVGYYVSLNETVTTDLGVYQKTVRGRYILKKSLNPVEKASKFEGALITEDNMLPIAFVVRDGVKLLSQNKSGTFKSVKKVKRYTHLPYLGTVKKGRKTYIQVGEDLYINKRTVALAEATELRRGIATDEKWIDIDLSEQTLIAYEGETPVFATIISSGREDFKTPTGSFRIYNKHVSITMDDTEAGAEAYSIEDVPWTQYFKDAYAIHAAFWHDRFGRVRSHGCINLAPKDAQRIFTWTDPQIPEGIHGIAVTGRAKGTRVFVHE